MDSTPKSLDQELKEALSENERLRKSLDECVAARMRAEQAARSASEELQQFAYAAGHDLKQPLRSISLYAELLRRECGDNQQSAEFTSFLLEGVAQMQNLIEALLSYSQTGPPARRTAISLTSVLQWGLLNVERLVRESGAQVTHGDLPVIAVDETQMVRVFQNLITNAVQYRGSEAPKIDVRAAEEDDNYVISVRDNGIGIEPKYHQQIFAPFKRLHGREVAGTGLGLALCRKIIEGHGGRIWVESDGENGSVFKFTLPM